MTNKIGKIIEVRGAPNPNSYIVQEEGNSNKTYLVHVGDLEQNEKLIYELYKDQKVTILNEGDQVEFESTTDHAIHVKKIN
ncbi:MAG: hypothetical protein EPN84_02195 [Legionella sp.]|nr:MAG: hypothetical protein EPN84_02195 [Legionella sp.]